MPALDPQLEDALKRVQYALAENKGRLLSHWRVKKIATLLAELHRKDEVQPKTVTRAPKISLGHSCLRPGCQESFTDQESLAEHIIHNHERQLLTGELEAEIMDRPVQICRYCDKEVSDTSLKVHLKAEHPYACNECSADFQTDKERATHNFRKHGHQFSCKVCFNTFKDHQGLKQHVSAKRHYWKCDLCPDRAPFDSSEAYERHCVAVKHPHSAVVSTEDSSRPVPALPPRIRSQPNIPTMSGEVDDLDAIAWSRISESQDYWHIE